jgi:hypothetical protein
VACMTDEKFGIVATNEKFSRAHWTSRGPLYAKPPSEILAEATEMYGIPFVTDDV